MKYFDYAATTPIHPDALKAYNEIAENFWGNTSSLHDIGTKSAQLLDNCRQELAKILNVEAKGLHFTSGGTEGNHLALLSLVFSLKQKGTHIITSAAEHASIHSVLAFLEGFGFQITKIPYSQNGQICLQSLQEAISANTILISIAHSNGEIGSIQPLQQVKERIGDRSILLHSDFVQSFGKVDLKEAATLVDSFTISAHKIYGPKGIGAVYIDPKLDVKPYLPFQTHEGGFRGGTVNVPAIAGFTVAAEIAYSERNTEYYQMLRNLFLQTLTDNITCDFTIINGAEQMPHVVGLCIEGIQGQWLMLECNRLDFAISTGSACQVGKQLPSPTMSAMNFPKEKAIEFVRISFGKHTTENDVIKLAETICKIAADFYK